MKFILFILIISILFCFKNLSAYEEISIQKTSNLKNYQDLLDVINISVTEENASEIIENYLYNINFSTSKISFDVDISGLSKNLYQKGFKFNLFMMSCSLRENFFEFNQNFKNCPNFKILKYNQEKFIYLNFKDKYFRLKNFNLTDDPHKLWINLLNKNLNNHQTYIDPDNFNKIVKFTGNNPKILSYKNNLVKIETKSYFTEKQFQFLLNFF
tara:strand:+ start:711 stop:1349 length:639 start_codon:yes stop_codon:yes gene_type:complete